MVYTLEALERPLLVEPLLRGLHPFAKDTYRRFAARVSQLLVTVCMITLASARTSGESSGTAPSLMRLHRF